MKLMPLPSGYGHTAKLNKKVIMEIKIRSKGVSGWVVYFKEPGLPGVGIVRVIDGSYEQALVEMYRFLNIKRQAKKFLEIMRKK